MTTDTLIAETRALFLARRNIDHPVATWPLRELLPTLCRSSNAAVACEAAACARGHDSDPCWKCGVVHGHAPGCVFATNPVPEREAA